jgi:hypothetical protein
MYSRFLGLGLYRSILSYDEAHAEACVVRISSSVGTVATSSGMLRAVISEASTDSVCACCAPLSQALTLWVSDMTNARPAGSLSGAPSAVLSLAASTGRAEV